MRALRVLGLIVVVTATGLLSGGAAGAVPTAEALMRAAAVPVAVPGPAAAVPPALLAAAPAPAAAPAAAAPAAVAPAAAAPAAAPVKPAPAEAKPVVWTVPGTPCLSTARACVDLSANKAWLIRGGAVQYGPVPITSGRKGFRTPTGTTRVSFKSRDHVSSIYDAAMPYSVFFNGGVAFHQGSLSEKSHGCIHLSRAAAKTFFGSLSRGDRVQVVQ